MSQGECALPRRLASLLITGALLGLVLLPQSFALPGFGSVGPASAAAAEGAPPSRTTHATGDPAPSQPDFTEDIVLENLVEPTVVEFASNGHIFVAEKRGAIKEFTGFNTTPTLWHTFREKVHNYWDRGLLGMALHPNFPTTPKIYVAYTHDAPIGGTAPTWGGPTSNSDGCPNPPGGSGYGCVVSSRISVLTKSGGVVTEQVLVEDWCQQYFTHSISDLVFGPDGYLYAGHGDGANPNYADYGQLNAALEPSEEYPNNPCGDPPGGVGGTMQLPSAEGGALRSQDVRTMGDPLGLDGTIIRIDPATGAGAPGNPMAGSADLNARRIIATGMRNPFRLAFRPGAGDLWIGDVGHSTTEELNRIADRTPASVLNFGWPCREGNAAGLQPLPTATICSGVTGSGPYFSYTHGAALTSPDCSPGSSSSISGVTFAAANTAYPPAYDGALFLADYSRNCIWAVPAGSGGLPNTGAVFKFADAAHPVHLTTGPDGDIYYVEYDPSNPTLGTVRRISYLAPVARISATPTSGSEPLFVQFDGSASTVHTTPRTFAWDLDGDGQYDDSTAASPGWTYANAGQVTVRLRVTDGDARQDTESIQIDVGENQAPSVSIASPSASFKWAVGDLVSFSGSATDAEDGSLPASKLNWTLLIHHCPGDCHQHVIQTWEGQASGSFNAPDHEYPAHLELRLTATDSYGHQVSASRVLQPKTSTVTVQSQPTGLSVTVASTTGSTPLSATGIVGSVVSLSAPSTQTRDGVTYVLDGWAHGGLASQDIVFGTTATTYTAIYSATFNDIADSPFINDIRWAAEVGITAGCGGGSFCPREPVTREQMASFLVRALELTGGATPDRFSDIAGSQHRFDINRLATAGITTGCGDGSFCPREPVTREQMASFLVRALELTAGATPDRFSDIAGSQHRFDINRLATSGITSGCGGGKYCPGAVVTREQMVAFLRRALT